MWLQTKVSTCGHQISHDFSIKLIKGEFEEQARTKRGRQRTKSVDMIFVKSRLKSQ